MLLKNWFRVPRVSLLYVFIILCVRGLCAGSDAAAPLS